MLTVTTINSPARFYVTDVSKLIVAHFIMNYDVKIADEMCVALALDLEELAGPLECSYLC